jgi:hypothetical protein
MKNKENGTVITRKHNILNFGQTGEILGFNEFSDEVYFKPHGDTKKYHMHYTEIWPQSQAYEYEARNKALEFLESGKTNK